MAELVIENKKRARFPNGDVLDLSGAASIRLELAGESRVLVLDTEAAVSPDGAYGDVVHLERALRDAPELAPEVADRLRAELTAGYRALETYLVLA